MRSNRSGTACRSRYGFTLIELLVVVAIIVVLISILMPSLSAARNQAKVVQCGSNMRAIGQALIGFSIENEGRLPGSGNNAAGNSWAWYLIVNAEYFGKGSTASDSMQMIQPLYGSAGGGAGPGGTANGKFNKALFCPLWNANIDGLWRRCYQYNLDASGSNGNAPPVITYGSELDASGRTLRASYYGTTTFSRYWLGAKYSSFNSGQFMVTETNRSSDLVKPVATTGVNGYMVPDPPFDTSGRTLLTGSYGSNGTGNGNSSMFMFRHNKQGTLAGFLCFDGHVENVKPTDEYNTARKLQVAN